MRKKGIFYTSLTLTLLLCCSCSALTGEMAGLLTPPTLSSNREALTSAIRAAVGEPYELVYPQTGSYRTGIISVELTGDGQNEAVCFFRPTSAGSTIGFLVLENRSGEWTLLARGESDAASLGRLAFGDLDGDGTDELIVGWQYLTASEGSYDVYAIEDGAAVSRCTGLYTSFTLLNDGARSLLTVMRRNSVTRSVTASLVGLNGGEIGVVNTMAMHSQSVSFLSVAAGTTAAGRSAVYVDEQLENGQYATEVLVISEQGRLVNELVNHLNASTWRYTAVYCQDVDRDGVPEVPTEEALPPYFRRGVEENQYLIAWNRFDGQQLSPVQYAFMQTTERFSVTYDTDWYGKVTVERAPENDRSFLFKTMEGEMLFTVRVYGLSEYSEELGRMGWRKLYTDSDHIYTVLCEDNNTLGVTYTKVYSLFNAI